MTLKINQEISELIKKANSDLKSSITSESIDGYKDTITETKKKAEQEIKQETTDKVTDTVKDATKETEDKIKDFDVASEVKKSLDGTDFALLVNDLIDDSIEELVEDELKKVRRQYNDSDVGQMIAIAESYYKDVFNSQKILTDIRNDYSDHLSTSINRVINDRLYDLQEKMGGKWARKLLGKSKLASTISKIVDKEVANVVNAIVSDKVIAGVSQDIENTVIRIQGSIQNQVETQFKDEIQDAQDLQKAVEDKIEVFEERKAEYEKKMQKQVEELQNAISEAIQQVEQVIIDEISKVIKLDASSFSSLF